MKRASGMVRLDVAINLLFHFGFVLVLVADFPDLRERFGCNPDFSCCKTGFRHGCRRRGSEHHRAGGGSRVEICS